MLTGKVDGPLEAEMAQFTGARMAHFTGWRHGPVYCIFLKYGCNRFVLQTYTNKKEKEKEKENYIKNDSQIVKMIF